jgi:hypothetical protein
MTNLTDLQAKRIEYISNLKQVVNGVHEDYFRWRWGDDYEENIKCLASALEKLLKQGEEK